MGRPPGRAPLSQDCGRVGHSRGVHRLFHPLNDKLIHGLLSRGCDLGVGFIKAQEGRVK